MAYRVEEEEGGIKAIVIDGWEKGIAESPYSGISNTRNVNTQYYPGTAYVNYKRQAATQSGGTMTKPMFSTTSPAGLIYILDDSQQTWKQNSAGGTTFTKIASAPTSGGTGNGLAYWQNYLVVFRSTAVDICGDGTGDGGITSSNWNTAGGTSGVWPITLNNTLTLTGSPSAGDTAASLSTYTDAQGTPRAFWNGPNGIYQMTFASGETTPVTLTQGSTDIKWTAPLLSNTGGTSATVTFSFSGQHQAFLPVKFGGKRLYFCNGEYVGSISADIGYAANKSVMTSFTVNYGPVRSQGDTVTWLTELYDNLVIAGKQNIYLWNYDSTATTSPIYINERIISIVNGLNNIYVFAGYKGNIYSTNGYNMSLFKKVPDGLFNLIDPYLQWGASMVRRDKLYVVIFASTSGGTGQNLAILSVDLSKSGAPLSIENQNSFGYTITAAAAANSILEDYPTAVMDSYFSAWYNNSAGGVDYNDTTLYTNFEPVIETDIIPLGTFFQQRTTENIEFKLDRLMANNDQIRLSFRTDLSSSYTTIGTTTAASPNLALSDSFNSNVTNAQWVQFKVEFACASSSSSRIPLREIRLH